MIASRTKIFFYNSLSTAINQIVVFLSGFIIPKCMLLYYGSEINGLVSSILQFISYFNLVEAGISGAAIYELYKPLAENNHNEISKIASAAKAFYMRSGYIFLVLTMALAIIYPIYIRTGVLSFVGVMCLVFLLGMNGCLEFFTLAKYRVLLSADQKTYIISIASIIYTLLQTLAIYFLSRIHLNIVLLRFFVLIAVIVRTVILMYYCRKHYDFVNYNAKYEANILSKRWDAFVLQVLCSVNFGAPVIILTIVLKDLKIISVYTIYNMIISGIMSVLGIFTGGLSASFGDVLARKQDKILKKAYNEFECAYHGILTIAYSTTFITIMPFVRIYTKGITDTNYNVPLVGFLLTLNALMYNINSPQGLIVVSAGMYRETRLINIIQTLIIIMLGFLLAPLYGLIGVLSAAIISNFYRWFVISIFVPKYITHLPIKSSFLCACRTSLNIVITFLICNKLLVFDIKTYAAWFQLAIETIAIATVVYIVSIYISEKTTLHGLIIRAKMIFCGR